jgi:hypothetical protein
VIEGAVDAEPAVLAGLGRPVAEACLAVLGVGLTDPAGAPLGPLDPAQWAALMAVAVDERLVGLLVVAVQTGVLQVTPEQRRAAEDRHVAAMAHVLRLERTLVEVAGALAGAGIDVRLLKGSATAHLDYPDPALRPFADIDLLVPGRDLEAAVAVLARRGFTPRQREPRPGFAARFGKGVALVDPAGTELDLHRTLAHGSYGITIDLAELWRGSDRLPLGPRSIPVLDAPSRLLHAAIHGVLGSRPARVLPLRDLAQLLASDVDTDAVLRRAAAWRLEAVLARGITDAGQLLSLPQASPLVTWARDYVPSELDQARLAAYDHPDNPYTIRALDSLRFLRRGRDRLAFAYSLAVPDRAFLAASGHTRFSWVMRGVRAAGTGLRRGGPGGA